MKKLVLAIIVTLQLICIASALTINSVDISPKETTPGKKTTVNFDIENTLDDIVYNVNVALDLTGLPFAPYQSSNQASVDEINDGKSYSFNFELLANADAESGVYKIPVIIDYTIDSERKQTKGLISIIINALPKIEISSDKSFLIKGQENSLTIKITNSGLGDARLLSVKLKDIQGIKYLNSNNVYIGTINSDDFDNSVFNILLSQNSPSTLNIPVEISYSDSRNNNIVEDKILTIKAYSKNEAYSLGLMKKNNTGLIISIVVIVIIGYLVYRNIRKRIRKKNLIQK